MTSSPSSPFAAAPVPNKVEMRDYGLLVLRLVFAGLLCYHGYGKIGSFDMLTDGVTDPAVHNYEFMNFMGLGASLSLILAIGAELGASALVLLGLATRLAAIPVIFTMIVATYVHVTGEPPLNTLEATEKALLFLGAFLAIFLTGPGRISIDAKLAGRKSRGK